MDKEFFRKQFKEKTKELDLKHAFTFDEAWDFMEYRRGIMELEYKFRQAPAFEFDQKEIDRINPLKHTYADGCVVREIFNPAGQLLITKIHKVAHPFFLLKGKMSILSENGVKEIEAPHYGITPAGTKRLIYTHTDCVFVTVHVTKERDPKKIEDEVIAKSFNDLPEIDIDTKEV